MSRIAISVLLSFLTLAAAPAMAQKRVALLIGNENYAAEVGRLKNPVNDISLISVALQKAGFKRDTIRMVRNADRLTLLDEIDRYVESLRAAGDDAVGFFYYSGHGIANKRDNRNYLIPVGVRSFNRRIWHNSVALDAVVSKLARQASNATHFVIFDACRNLLNSPTRGAKGFKAVRSRRGMLIAFSTDPGETATDRGENSGPYAAALAAELQRPGLDNLDIFQNVRERVHQKTGSQVPWTRDGMLKRVYLNPRQGRPDQGASQQPSVPSLADQAEIEFWKSAAQSGDREFVLSYLTQHPNGKFINQARDLHQQLQQRAELTKQLQSTLKQRGCYAGAVDGVWGRSTKAALRRIIGNVGSLQSPSQDFLVRLHAEKHKSCKTPTAKTAPNTLRGDQRRTSRTPSTQRTRATKNGCRSLQSVCGTNASNTCKFRYREYVASGC